jgi:hypothetical protein
MATDEIYLNISANTLHQYTKTLAEIWYTNTVYPFTLLPVYGIPYQDYAHAINSKEELLGRIKLLCQILNLQKVNIKVHDAEIELTLSGGN